MLRALGRWRGSTVAGYLRGDDRTYLENFRCSQHRFDDMVMRLAGSGLDKAERREDHPVPSEMREQVCGELWAEVCGDRWLNGEVVARMQERARVGFGGEECE